MIMHNGQTLAYIGDAIFELLVREHLLNSTHGKIGSLHDETVALTCAQGQANALRILKPHLSVDEMTIVKRGRNGKLTRKARNVDVQTYQYATGLEALFGYLHLNKNEDRIEVLFKKIVENND